MTFHPGEYIPKWLRSRVGDTHDLPRPRLGERDERRVADTLKPHTGLIQSSNKDAAAVLTTPDRLTRR